MVGTMSDRLSIIDNAGAYTDNYLLGGSGFITHLANRASLKRLEQPRYCQDMNRVFQEAQAQPRQGLMAYVQARTLQGEPVRHLAAMDTAAGDKPSKRPVLED